MIIEPCCFRKQFDELLANIENNGNVAHFFTNGDLSLPEFMDYFIGRSPGCDVFLSLIRVDACTLATIYKLMGKKDRNGNFLIKSFTLLSQGYDREAINNTLSKFRNSGRLLVCEDKESFRCLTVGNTNHNYILNGSINQSPVFSMQMFTITTSEELYEDTMKIFGVKKRIKKVK